MKLVVFGLTVSSSWGNGHATLWRALAGGLAALGHELVFFERDVPYYALHRDLFEISGGRLRLYPDFTAIREEARRELDGADVGMVTSYCPDAQDATDLLLASRAAVRAYYDMDTPITLDRIAAGEAVPYIPTCGLGVFDVVLSFTGGASLDALRHELGARCVAPLYGSVDPALHRPVAADERFRSDLSYLGTYSAERQPALSRLLLEPARALPERRFLIAGSMYPEDFPWLKNVWYLAHVAPPEHPAFYCSSPLTLNVTRAPMARSGWCPSGRLFEAAACGVPVLSDSWQGIDAFFEPGREILIANSSEEVREILSWPRERLSTIGAAARRRALAEHTGLARARELLQRVAAPARGVRPGPREEVARCGE